MRRTTQGRRRTGKRSFSLLLVVCLLAVSAYYIVMQQLPNSQHVEPDWKGLNKPIFVKGELLEYSAVGTGDNLMLPLPVLQEVVDPNIRYELESKSIILTTPAKLMHLKTDKKTAEVNNQSIQLRFAPEETEGVLYLPLQPLKELYGIKIHEDANTGAVLLMRAGETIPMGKVDAGKPDKTIAIRQDHSIHSPILTDVSNDTELRVWKTNDEDWDFVQLDNGYAGYMEKKHIVMGKNKVIEVPAQKTTRAERSWKGKPVNLVWEAVYQRKPDPNSIGKLPGVNVVSPTWFSMIDGEGNVRSQADSSYVKWAHGQKMEVWGLLSNSFEPDLTSEAMSKFKSRINIINQMLKYAELYDLDGINLDFENVYTKDGDNISQFVREIKPLAEARGLIISVDVTPKSKSEMWSLFLDREALGSVADYLIVMAYDEHWAASPKAGSVASLPWVEAALQKIITEDHVPPEKLILGIPLYTRIWSEEMVDGKTKVSSKSVGMDSIAEIIRTKKLTPSYLESPQQNYVEYTEEGILKKIWIEDEVSLQARVDLVKSLNLGGIASWNRSFSNKQVWEVLKGVAP
ncbi:glycosyl hydrolase family 18 protein [Paenibacillus sp. IHBB 10380]|uniref:glycosyl hydrolase family 18 protein n=1 Tax=Paenibacillus sp. IHBB 10380 TaxID=1566358 RepID=UPI0005DA64EE|nr:glycosyl hydrolase family 18 protein [Paenibacillus sp. IHBB 10380]AJS60110.1 glycosyl hydrolase [Paenibacillus sp. IHBB 10380]